jgi:hypothetical protein
MTGAHKIKGSNYDASTSLPTHKEKTTTNGGSNYYGGAKRRTQGRIERFFQTFELYHPRFDNPTQFREYYNQKPHRTLHSSLPEVRYS